MKHLSTTSRRLVLGALLAFPLGFACDDSSSNCNVTGTAGTAGTAGKAGTAGTAGTAGLGGTAGKGGAGGSAAGGAGGPAGGAGGSAGGIGGAAGGAGGMAGGTAAALEFTDFVNDLIVNHSTDPLPTTINDKTFKDSMNPAAFSALFP